MKERKNKKNENEGKERKGFRGFFELYVEKDLEVSRIIPIFAVANNNKQNNI